MAGFRESTMRNATQSFLSAWRMPGGLGEAQRAGMIRGKGVLG